MRHLLMALLALAAAAPAAGACAQSPAAGDPAVRRAEQLVAAINSGSRDSVRAYVAATFSPGFLERIPLDDHARILAGMHADGGKLLVQGIDSSEAGTAVALVRSERTEEWRRLVVRVEPDGAHRIAGVGFRPAEAPADPNARPLADAEVAAQLRAYVERLARNEDFSGAVLVARNGKTLWSGAYGQADRNFAVPNRVDTKFNLGSMNKMVTAVAIMQLVEQGKVRLEDPVSRHVPGVPNGDAVTIEQLLSHTSGLGDYFTPEWEGTSRARWRTVDDWMALVKKQTPRFAPGERWAYSNAGFMVLGKVVEAASGMDYFDYVRERIYRPAGMTATDAYDLDVVTPNLAVGYERERTPKGVVWRNNIFEHVIRGGPAGGGYSTVEDLARFADALRSDRLVSAASRARLWTPTSAPGSPGYALGFIVTDGGAIVGHSGGFTGISSNLDIFPKDGWTIVVLSNTSGGSQPVVQKARALVRQGRGEVAKR